MTTRRLAAILAADVVGFSSMMERDEEGTLRLLKTTQRDLIEPRVREHHGRIVKTTGDGYLIEFGSPLDAVRCALEVQEAVSAGGEPGGSEEPLRFRIGINLGDIIIEDDGDIYGDGVNVATRLEQIAAPGSVCISGKVFDEVEGKLPTAFGFTGEQQVKNLTRAVRVYSSKGAPDPTGDPRPLPLPQKPSIAVLPFTNMSGDPEQEYFADGVIEDIITALSRFRWLFVIARNSSFTFKGRAVDTKQVGRELGVRYVLEGSIRRSGNRVRVAAQLIEASAGGHLWADRFDGLLDDIFALQDKVTAGVISAISPKLEQAEIERAHRKPTEDLQAYDYYLRGIASFRRSGQDTWDEALSLFRAAFELDPGFASAYGMAASCYSSRKAFSRLVDYNRDVAETAWLVRQVQELGREDAVALATGGNALAYVVGDGEGGAALLDRALALNPNHALAWLWSGWALVWLGKTDQAIERLTQAMRLSPLDPSLTHALAGMAHAHFHAGRYEEAIAWGEKALRDRPNNPAAARIIAAACALAGKGEQAQSAMRRVRELAPALRVSNLRETLGPYTPDRYARYEEALRLAGLPE